MTATSDATQLWPPPAFRLGVVGNRDLNNTDRTILTETVQRFFQMLDEVLHEAAEEANALLDPTSDAAPAPRLFVVDSLAEGADQLVVDAAVRGGARFHLRTPIPFTSERYKSLFDVTAEDPVGTFDRITQDPKLEPIIVELGGDPSRDRAGDYAAAADVLLDNCDLLLAVYDPDAPGNKGGTADTVQKGRSAGLPVVRIDLRQPNRLVLLEGRESDQGGVELSADVLRRIVSNLLVPPASEGLRRFASEPLTTGGALSAVLSVTGYVYGLFWAAVPGMGSLVSALRPKSDRDPYPTTPLPDREDPDAAAVIDEVQRAYSERLTPIDALARFYMRFYRGSFVMNFLTGALAVLFGLLSYFHRANPALWVGAELAALVIIFGNFVTARTWDWHGRAFDYRFLVEYLRHVTVLAPIGRSAPLVRPAPQYRGHDPIETWMGWYVRAVDRDQGMIETVVRTTPTVIRIDEAFVETMRTRLCRGWLLGQIEYYSRIERRFEGAATAIRGLMLLLFIVIAAGVIAHMMGEKVPVDPDVWREGVVLTIIVVALPAFLGAIHGIAVQSELERTADRAGQMRTYLQEVLEDIRAPSSESGSGSAELAARAVAAARLMLGEVLDWRIIHQAHEVELT